MYLQSTSNVNLLTRKRNLGHTNLFVFLQIEHQQFRSTILRSTIDNPEQSTIVYGSSDRLNDSVAIRQTPCVAQITREYFRRNEQQIFRPDGFN